MKQELKNTPQYNIVVKLTTNCPGNCICCTNRKNEIENKCEKNENFNLSTFAKLCKSVKNIGGTYICLSGGEPTIVKNIDDYFQVAHSLGLSVRMNTNGWNISKSTMEKWLSLGLEQIVLSIYSLNRDIIKETRGNEKIYYRSVEAAKTISELRQQYKFKFIIQTTIMQNNYQELHNILEFAIKNNADYFWPSYLEDAINLPTIRMDKAHIIDFKTNIIPKMKLIANKYYNEDFEKIYNALDNLYKKNYTEFTYHEENFHCHWLGRHLTFYPGGTVYPCPGHDYFSSECEYKIDYDYIEDFISSERFSQTKNSYSEHCKYCPQGEYQEIDLSKRKECNK